MVWEIIFLPSVLCTAKNKKSSFRERRVDLACHVYAYIRKVLTYISQWVQWRMTGSMMINVWDPRVKDPWINKELAS